jgi:hypothetical protein
MTMKLMRQVMTSALLPELRLGIMVRWVVVPEMTVAETVV